MAYETNSYSSSIAEYFLENISIIKKYNKSIIESREWFKKKLASLKISFYGSESMFLLLRLGQKKAAKVKSIMSKSKIYIKGPLNKPFDDTVLITIGPKPIMNKFLIKLKKIIY